MTVTTIHSAVRAYEQNEELLRGELKETIATLNATLKAQGTVENGLRDRISLLEAEGDRKEQRIEELEKRLQSERAALAATTRQAQQFQDRVVVLEKKERILTEAIAVMDALEAQATYWQNCRVQYEAAVDATCHSDADKVFFKTRIDEPYIHYKGVPTPSHWLSLLQVLEEARKP